VSAWVKAARVKISGIGAVPERPLLVAIGVWE
jgi:hypothetical protein